MNADRTAAEPAHGVSAAAQDRYPVRFPVVALIASAGGIDALSRVLAPLPADLPATLLVVLHQDPERISSLAMLLSASTRLRVEVARDRQVMRRGQVLVTPPGQHLIVTSEARIGLIPSGVAPPSRPSGDLLLTTLAVTCGHRALAVILTGRGHDAQAGVRAIAHCGGLVLAQNEETSQYFAMPAAAIATGCVSGIVALGEIHAAIQAHVSKRTGA